MIYPDKHNLLTKIAPHFTLGELLDNPGDGYPKAILPALGKLALLLELLRGLLGHRPIVITSGYRTPEFNKLIGGTLHSYHLLGQAADIVVPGVTHKAVSYGAKNYFKGVILYPAHVHVDTRIEEYFALGEYRH